MPINCNCISICVEIRSIFDILNSKRNNFSLILYKHILYGFSLYILYCLPMNGNSERLNEKQITTCHLNQEKS